MDERQARREAYDRLSRQHGTDCWRFVQEAQRKDMPGELVRARLEMMKAGFDSLVEEMNESFDRLERHW
jgi:hypothetical protein